MICREIERILFDATREGLRSTPYYSTSYIGHRRLGAEILNLWGGRSSACAMIQGLYRASGSRDVQVLRLTVCAHGGRFELTFAREEAAIIGAWLTTFLIVLDVHPDDRPRVELPVPEHRRALWGAEYRWTAAADKAYRLILRNERALS